jgi:hypothetical protein
MTRPATYPSHPRRTITSPATATGPSPKIHKRRDILRGSVEDVFLNLQRTLSLIANGIAAWRRNPDGSLSELWEAVKDVLLVEDYTIYIQNAKNSDIKAGIGQLAGFAAEGS